MNQIPYPRTPVELERLLLHGSIVIRLIPDEEWLLSKQDGKYIITNEKRTIKRHSLETALFDFIMLGAMYRPENIDSQITCIDVARAHRNVATKGSL